MCVLFSKVSVAFVAVVGFVMFVGLSRALRRACRMPQAVPGIFIMDFHILSLWFAWSVCLSVRFA